MNAAQQQRAVKGGEVGTNGEFYEGGKFLPNTGKPKGTPRRGTGKVQIAPYVWEVAPEGMKSIWGAVSAVDGCGFMVRDQMHLMPDSQIAYFGGGKERVRGLARRWLAGERWMGVDE